MSRPALKLSLQFADARHRSQLPRHTVSRCIRAALDCEGEITVRIVDAEEGRTLNRSYRGKDYATNVLTFDYSDAPVVVADLVLVAEVVEREAAEQGKSVLAHYFARARLGP
jgi:probable rRNA maturation factor